MGKVVAVGDGVTPEIEKRNKQFEKDTPCLLVIWKIFRESIDVGGNFVNEAACRLPVDILLKLVWQADPDYSYMCVSSSLPLLWT